MISGPFRVAPSRRTVFAIALCLLNGFLISQLIRKVQVILLMMVLAAGVRICPKIFYGLSKYVRKTLILKIDVRKNLTVNFFAIHVESVLHGSALKTYRILAIE